MNDPASMTIIISSILTLIGTLGGILTASKLSNYRIEQLEKKVDKHNNLIEKTYGLEKDQNEIRKDLDNLSSDHEKLKTQVHDMDTRVILLEKGRS